MGRIERGCGDDGEPVQSPLGQHELSLAVWLRLVSRKVCGRAGRALLRSWHAPSIGRFVWGGYTDWKASKPSSSPQSGLR